LVAAGDVEPPFALAKKTGADSLAPPRRAYRERANIPYLGRPFQCSVEAGVSEGPRDRHSSDRCVRLRNEDEPLVLTDAAQEERDLEPARGPDHTVPRVEVDRVVHRIETPNEILPVGGAIASNRDLHPDSAP